MADVTAIQTLLQVSVPVDLNQAAKLISNTGVADIVERQRIMREVLSRPNQSKFRRDVLSNSGSECVITGTQLDTALEAAHIIPVKENGGDVPANGFCMRSDIHNLYDNGHLRIDPLGLVHLSIAAQSDRVYKLLPKQVVIPAYIGKKNLEWRWNYV